MGCKFVLFLSMCIDSLRISKRTHRGVYEKQNKYIRPLQKRDFIIARIEICSANYYLVTQVNYSNQELCE